MKVLNRIVTFLMAAAIFPVFILQCLLRAVVSISEDSSLYTVLSALMKDSNSADSRMEITLSLKELVEYVKDGSFSIGGMNFSLDKLELTNKSWLVAAAVMLVLALIVAVVIMGCALFAQAHKTVMSLAAGGIVLSFAAVRCFSHFAGQFLNGSVDIGTILSESLIGDNTSILGSIGSAFLEGAIKVDVFQLSNAVMLMGMFFFFVLLWTLAYFVTMPKEKELKKIVH